MSQPTPYTPTTDFSQDEANNLSGRSTVRTANLDAEFANIGTTLGQALANLALLQRDDGRLKDLACELHTLSPEVLNLMGGFNLRGLWQAGTAYKANDIVSNEAYTYCCTVDHTSGGSFDGQYWIQFGFSSGADAAQAAAAAQVSANNASSSAGTATTQAGIATTQAGIATTQAGNAATSANTATSQAGAASVSAVNAANSAIAAQAASSNLPNATTAGGDKFLKTNAGGSAWEYLTGAQAAAAIGGANLATAIGATAVTNATNATNVTGAATSAFALTADISPAQITANQNDYNPTDLATANTLRLSTDASRDLTGLQGGADGRLMIVHNVGSNPLVLKNESASSTAANRFYLGGADVTLAANQSVTLQYDSTSSRWRLTHTAGSSRSGTSGVRQTAQTGPVTTAGLPNFMPATSSGSSVSSQNITASAPLVVTAAGGEADRTATRTTNLSWSGLTVTNAVVNYGYVDVAADGTLTTGVTTQEPVYQQGGTPAATSGLTTFNIGEMRGYTGNGSAASQSYRVFLWEGTGNGTNVAGIVAYAYNGYYDSGYSGTLPGPSTLSSKNHNIGIIPGNMSALMQCTTTDMGYAVGDELDITTGHAAYGGPQPVMLIRDRKVGAFMTGTWAASPVYVYNKSTGAGGAATSANWKWRIVCNRGW